MTTGLDNRPPIVAHIGPNERYAATMADIAASAQVAHALDWGQRGERIKLFAGELVPCIRLGMEFTWKNRLARVTTIDRESGYVELTFEAEWFSAGPNGVLQHTDSMEGLVMVEPWEGSG